MESKAEAPVQNRASRLGNIPKAKDSEKLKRGVESVRLAPQASPAPDIIGGRTYFRDADLLYSAEMTKWAREQDPAVSTRQIAVFLSNHANYRSEDSWHKSCDRKKTDIEDLIEDAHQPGKRWGNA